MAEELRFFLRTAVYAAVIAGVYWFASHDPLTGAYDWAGTALLVATGIAAALVVAVMAAHVRRAVGDGGRSPLRRLGGW
ncbi:MAG: hypothetical protein ACRDHD_08960, partial [Candidatus Limnocylindria bacterium]